MRAVATVLKQALDYWRSDSSVESIIAIAMAAGVGVAVLTPYLRPAVEKLL